MRYVALLRGINVGGKQPVAMAKLKVTFERLGHLEVTTYINSGNVMFTPSHVAVTASAAAGNIAAEIEKAILEDFDLPVGVVVRSQMAIAGLCQQVPESWINDSSTMKTDVMFLWESADRPDVLEKLSIKPELDHVVYIPGAIVWQVDRTKIGKSGLLKIVGTPLYKQMTIRNINTVRKLNSLLSETGNQN